MKMTLGQLRHRVTLRCPVPLAERVGAGKVDHRNAGRVRASVRPYRESEIARFRQQERKCEREVVIRRREDVDTGWRLVYADVEYEIESIGPDEDRQWATLKIFKVGG